VDITGKLFKDQFLPHLVQGCLVQAKKLREGAIREPPLTLQQGAHQVLVEAHQGAVDDTTGRQETLVTRPGQPAPRVIDDLGMRIEEFFLEDRQVGVIQVELEF
jgi:hypothetical protein